LRQLYDRGTRWIGFTAALILLGVLGSAPPALAKTTKSTNWAGYAIHRASVSFRTVSGGWIQPHASCAGGQSTYSAVWVGLGGYQTTSNALEQIGTEIDCNPQGRVISSAWYELVPAPSRTISFPVAPGDALHATVTVVGHRTMLELDNLTQHRSFRKTFNATSVDVSSAEWIVEAPSECINQFACQALPLANFGSVTFDSAAATPGNGAAGAISDGRWGRTKIKLISGGQRFLVARSTTDVAGSAAPSSLRAGGSVFDVTYATATVPPGQASAREARLRAAYLQH
jgi:Peptidase A4 family